MTTITLRITPEGNVYCGFIFSPDHERGGWITNIYNDKWKYNYFYHKLCNNEIASYHCGGPAFMWLSFSGGSNPHVSFIHEGYPSIILPIEEVKYYLGYIYAKVNGQHVEDV